MHKSEPEPAPTANGLKGLLCSKCGVENAAHAKFCKACGNSMTRTLAIPEPPPVSEPSAAPILPPISAPPPTPVPSPMLVVPLIPAPPPPPVPEPLPVESPPPAPVLPPIPAPPPVSEPPLAPAPLLVAEFPPAPVPQPEMVPPPAPILPPISSPPSIPATDVMNGVACYKCQTINNPTAKFCKSCGTPNPGTTPAQPPNPPGPGDPKKPWVLWASIAAGVSAVAIGGAYWMFAGGTKPKTTSVPAAPLPQRAASAPAPAALPAPAAAVASSAPAPETAASAAAAGTPVLPAPAPPLPGTPAQDEAKANKPQIAASAPRSPPAATKMLPDELKEGPTPAQRDAREAARKRQAELDQIARQKERDKASMNKANRTLDDLLK